jgi:hypothetical protein
VDKKGLKLENNHFLHFHRMQNPLHDNDREKASSIVKNLVIKNLAKNKSTIFPAAGT